MGTRWWAGRSLLVILVSSCCGCYPFRISNHRPFVLHQMPISQGSGISVPRTTGLYVSSNGSSALFFYADGKVLFYDTEWLPGWFWKNPDSSLWAMENAPRRFYRDSWGVYSVRHDSLELQSFAFSWQRSLVHHVVDLGAQQFGDTVFHIGSIYQHEFNRASPWNSTYRYYPCTFRPDSSKAWFSRKPWYRKHLHPDRR